MQIALNSVNTLTLPRIANAAYVISHLFHSTRYIKLCMTRLQTTGSKHTIPYNSYTICR